MEGPDVGATELDAVPEATIEQLGEALQARRETSMAVGIIMERRRLNRRAAFEVLRARARAQRRRIHDVAQDLVNALDALNST